MTVKNNKKKRSRRSILLLAVLLVASIGGLAAVLEQLSISPRQLSPYIERRAEGHDANITRAAAWVGSALMRADRGAGALPAAHAWRIGAQPTSAPAPSDSTDMVRVSTPAEFTAAAAQARAGQVIALQPGTYRFGGNGYIDIRQPGRDGAPITVRAERPDTVFLEFNMGEGFLVSAPWWIFENLHIQGVCMEQQFCEHAFHVVGKAAHFVARNNTIVDFNAHFKINGDGGAFPDDGLIDGNTLTNSTPRKTDSPVTPIDLVAANHWRISHNLITDFIKDQGDRISYGAFVKGAGSGNRIEQNIVLCEDRLHDLPGQRVGLSLGGGGTGKEYCRDQRCITEQDGGVIQSNLIASCSDDGIYLNRAAASKVFHNTLVDTGAISVRFPESTADVEGNLVDSVVHARNEALLRADENIATGTTRLYLGMHPVRSLFADAPSLDFTWKKKPPVRDDLDVAIPDLCSPSRPSDASYGAFEDFAACLRR